MIRSNKGMTVIKGSREDVFADFVVVVNSLKGALVEGGMSSDKAEALIMDMVKVRFEDEENECSGSKTSYLVCYLVESLRRESNGKFV